MDVIYAFDAPMDPAFQKERSGCLTKCLVVTAIFTVVVAGMVAGNDHVNYLGALLMFLLLPGSCLLLTWYLMRLARQEQLCSGPRLEYGSGSVIGFLRKDPVLTVSLAGISGVEVTGGCLALRAGDELTLLDIGWPAKTAELEEARKALEAYVRYTADGSLPRPKPAVPNPLTPKQRARRNLKISLIGTAGFMLWGFYLVYQEWSKTGGLSQEHWFYFGIQVFLLLCLPVAFWESRKMARR